MPKVHVEASIIGSIILAGGVLKLGILYYWNFRVLILVGVLVVFSLVYLIVIMDGKGFAAYSSVLHITLCVIVSIVVIILVGYIHIIISPLMFISIYIMYVYSRSRIYVKRGVLMIVLWIINFGLPFIRRFFSEVYIIINSRIILLILLIIYMVVRYVIMKSLNNTRVGLIYLPWIVLYLLII